MAVHFQPEGMSTVSPYLMVANVDAELDFQQAAFDAEVLERIERPDGAVMHAETRIGDTVVMLGGGRPEFPAMPAWCYVYVEDCDEAFRRALAAGGECVQLPADMFYGHRNAGVESPAGITWWIATKFEDLTAEEIAKRAAAQGQG